MQLSGYAAAMTSALAHAMAFPIAGFEEGLPLWQIKKNYAFGQSASQTPQKWKTKTQMVSLII